MIYPLAYIVLTSALSVVRIAAAAIPDAKAPVSAAKATVGAAFDTTATLKPEAEAVTGSFALETALPAAAVGDETPAPSAVPPPIFIVMGGVHGLDRSPRTARTWYCTGAVNAPAAGSMYERSAVAAMNENSPSPVSLRAMMKKMPVEAP